jgi:hypothetical protein
MFLVIDQGEPGIGDDGVQVRQFLPINKNV